MGHVEHEDHIPRTLLAIMESEGVVDRTKKQKLGGPRTHDEFKTVLTLMATGRDTVERV
jgi:hypothetical protein